MAQEVLLKRCVLFDKIEINPDIMLGKPVVKGTRITVELIIEKLKQGATFEDLIYSHPRLTREGIQAAIDFSSQISKDAK